MTPTTTSKKRVETFLFHCNPTWNVTTLPIPVIFHTSCLITPPLIRELWYYSKMYISHRVGDICQQCKYNIKYLLLLWSISQLRKECRNRSVWEKAIAPRCPCALRKRTTRATSPGIEPRTFWLWRQSVKPSATTVSDYVTNWVEIWRNLDVVQESSTAWIFSLCFFKELWMIWYTGGKRTVFLQCEFSRVSFYLQNPKKLWNIDMIAREYILFSMNYFVLLR